MHWKNIISFISGL